MKKVRMIGMILMVFLVSLGISVSATYEPGNRGSYGSNPVDILQKVVESADPDLEVHNTKLNNINSKTGIYPRSYSISNTLDYLRKSIYPYLQRIVYLGLVSAVILLIWNGFLLVTGSAHKSGDIKKVRENILNILLGVVIMMGFVAILRLVIAVLNYFFGS